MAELTKPSTTEVEHEDKEKPGNAQVSNIDPVAQRSLLRKLDYRMMPVFFILYFLNHWDRNGLPQAKLNGISDHLGLQGTQYNTCISILYVGYLTAGIPSNMILTRVRPSVYMGVCMCGWAIVSAFTAMADNYVHLLVLRLFIIEGSATFLAAIGGIFLLPDTPGKTRWLTAEENACSVMRLEEENMNELKHETPIQGLMSALKDYKVWLFMFMQNMHFSAMSFNQFFPTIVKTLGYDRTITLVLTSPPYVFAAMFALALSWSSGRFDERAWHIYGGNALTVVGFAVACATTSVAPRYVACFLFAAGSYSTGSIILGWAAANVVDSHEKKAVTMAMVNFSAVAANIYTAYLWPDSDSPRFLVGLGSSIGFCVMCMLSAHFAWFLFRRLNRQRLREADGDSVKLFAT
ncbi:putative transporter [Colletotrichum fructicola Nara gc5]|uniref:Putative transporter n=1 Tax=Colletotrichum fructicola (strain Nara gc5) TaxID=1213859 RepID=A0A7J6JQT5_COLFN|nr:putative transporter [Colletotrichum fructicola Nara gc5]